MVLLGERLRQQGQQPHYFGYAPCCEDFERITRRLTRFIRRVTRGQCYLLVGHSLGGILARASLPALTDMPPQHLVMLATPNRPSTWARILRTNWLFRLVAGDSGYKLGDAAFYAQLPLPRVPTTVVAGTCGMPRVVSPFGEQTNDMIVSVAETRMPATAGQRYAHVCVQARHALIMNRRGVCALVRQLVQ